MSLGCLLIEKWNALACWLISFWKSSLMLYGCSLGMGYNCWLLLKVSAKKLHFYVCICMCIF
jgi:hypothetical protein